MSGVREVSGGFTLLEILIAISIFAVVVTTIFGSFNFVFGNVDAVENSMTSLEMASDGINRISTDLQTIYVSQPPAYAIPESSEQQDPYRVVGEIVSVDGGEFGRLRFTSFSHLPLGRDRRQGIAEIVYYVEKQPDATLTLKRSDRIDFSEPAEEQSNDPILFENIVDLKFTYLDAAGDERDRWDSDSEEFEYATPRAVRIQFTVGTDEMLHSYEVMVALPLYRDNPETTQLQSFPSEG